MLIELLSMSNYGNYNIRVAQILGLETAVYLNELMNINEKALRKQKLEDNFFVIDRSYIESRTTFSAEKQNEIEAYLLKIGILEKAEDNPDNISLQLGILTSMLTSPDEQLLKNISNLKKVKSTRSSKAAKNQAIAANLKANIVTTNEELVAAYSEWIDTVMSKENWMSTKAVVCAQKVVDNFSNRNLDLALKIIEIATINGYRNMEWAVEAYKKDYNINYRIHTPVATTTPVPPPVSEPVVKPRLSKEVF